MFYKLGKKIFSLLVDFLKFLQVALIFLSFFVILYWILQLANVKFIAFVAPFFEGIKNITHAYYTRTADVGGITIDFSFLVATFFILSFAWFLKFGIELVEFLEAKYDSIYKYFKKKAEDLFNFGLEKQYLIQEHKNNKFLVIIKFDAINFSKDKFFNKDSDVGVEEKQKEILKDFSNSIEVYLNCQKKFLNDEILLYFESFNDIEDVISLIEKRIAEIKQKYMEEKWQVNFVAGIEVFADIREISSKTEKLLKLINLGLRNNISCLATFKQRYSLIKNPKYAIEGQGVYKINEDENVFVIKILK